MRVEAFARLLGWMAIIRIFGIYLDKECHPAFAISPDSPIKRLAMMLGQSAGPQTSMLITASKWQSVVPLSPSGVADQFRLDSTYFQDVALEKEKEYEV